MLADDHHCKRQMVRTDLKELGCLVEAAVCVSVADMANSCRFSGFKLMILALRILAYSVQR